MNYGRKEERKKDDWRRYTVEIMVRFIWSPP